jgi:signal transduction histidine kinase
MKKTLPADSEILQYLYQDGGVRGEKVAMRFRWLLVVLVLLLITVMFFNGQVREAGWSLIPVSVFIIYNLFLIYLFRREKIPYWVRYLSVIIDVSVLSAHIYVYSSFFSELAVATTASILIYPILLFLSVLRYDRKLIIFATVYTIACFNLIYYLRYPDIDKSLIAQVVSSDPAGHFYKSMYLMLLGIFLLHIPRLVVELIGRQERIIADRKESEIRLALEKQEKRFLEEKLTFERKTNAELSRMNEQIQVQNDQLQMLVQARDKLQSVISHDLRNPLTVINSVTETLNERIGQMDEAELAKVVKVIHETNARGLNLLDNLLNWSRMQTGKIQVVPSVVPLYPVIRDTIKLFRTSAEEKEISLNIDFSNQLAVYCDEDMFRTIMRNLVSNAIKFTTRGGSVNITGEVVLQDQVLIRVSDTGIGISPSNLKRLFSLNESLSTPGTANEKGSGIGLSLVREFVAMNKGSLEVESSEGTGTTFSLYLSARPVNNIQVNNG